MADQTSNQRCEHAELTKCDNDGEGVFYWICTGPGCDFRTPEFNPDNSTWSPHETTGPRFKIGDTVVVKRWNAPARVASYLYQLEAPFAYPEHERDLTSSEETKAHCPKCGGDPDECACSPKEQWSAIRRCTCGDRLTPKSGANETSGQPDFRALLQEMHKFWGRPREQEFVDTGMSFDVAMDLHCRVSSALGDPVCAKCERRFSQHKTVISHDFTHRSQLETKARCPKCGGDPGECACSPKEQWSAIRRCTCQVLPSGEKYVCPRHWAESGAPQGEAGDRAGPRVSSHGVGHFTPAKDQLCNCLHGTCMGPDNTDKICRAEHQQGKNP